MKTSGAALVAVVLFAGSTWAQDAPEQPPRDPPVDIDQLLGPTGPQTMEEKAHELTRDAGAIENAIRQSECSLLQDDRAQERCWQASAAFYEYLTRELSRRSQVFWWRHLFSKIIFFVVMLIVAIGLYFAWRQFAATEKLGESERTRELGSSIELGAGGVKVSSPVLGIIILALSLGFFYLYLAHVYPIVEVF
jgi:hypothetical protein